MTPEMKQALAILDGTDKPDRGVPREPGLHWSPGGHFFVLDGSLAPALSQAVRAEVVLFGTGRLTFGVAVRFLDAAGGATPWTHAAYSWGRDSGHWPVTPVADRRLVPLEERQVTFVVFDVTGREIASRQIPLTADFAFDLRGRVALSRSSNSKSLSR